MKTFACGIALAFAACVAPAAAMQAPAAPSGGAMAAGASDSATYPANYAELTALFADWRQFLEPVTRDFKPDYSLAAMAAKQAELPKYVARLHAIDTSGWPKGALIDYKLVQAEMNGLDFDFRILKPWARDPTFYATVFAEQSDVPVHEGPWAYPHIDLYAFKYPLNAADEKKLTAMLAAVPANLKAAKVNLRDSNARGLWEFGDRAFKEQGEALAAMAGGKLVMRTLEGEIPADMKGASPRLLAAIRNAKAATDDFAAWVAAEAPKKTGPTGVGKENYNWYAKNVQLIPYDWDAQVLLMQRELDRSLSSLKLEELRNRDVPPIKEITDPAAYDRMAQEKASYLVDFMQKAGFAGNEPYVRPALMAQAGVYTPPDQRVFFTHVTALDPLPLQSHSTHWVDLARLKHEPNPSPIRRAPSVFNIFDVRSEGFATAFEEVLMHAGLYDDVPHGKELVWIMAANRAARGLASLYVQANEWDLDQAGRFHGEWTPRHWSDPKSKLVGFEQLLYARQPGYGTSYILGKLQLDHLIARVAHDDEQAGRPFVMRDVMNRIWAAGILPVQLIEAELTDEPVTVSK
ncbi:MAG: DUF885 family protein [Xanthomonadales bacterium]|nr:DUF885 family protein [Xanthomonadales bacterium]